MARATAVEEWVALLDDPTLATCTIDRLAHRAHYRPVKRPILGDGWTSAAPSNAVLARS